jgi:hypothetical protein
MVPDPQSGTRYSICMAYTQVILTHTPQFKAVAHYWQGKPLEYGKSYLALYGTNGRLAAHIYGMDPLNTSSMTLHYNKHGKLKRQTYSGNPKDPRSKHLVYDESGNFLRCIYGENPDDPRSYQVHYKDGKAYQVVYGRDPSNLRSYYVDTPRKAHREPPTG